MKQWIAGAALALATMTGTAYADGHSSYPERPIMMMVSYGAGGATDFQARIVTMTAGNEDALGMPIAIVNRPGAGGRVGWNWLATEAEADGYTLGAYNIPHFVAQSIEGGVSYSTDSFEPIANWGADPAVFVVGADSEFNSMADVVDYAKANPGGLTFSGAGLFVGHHIAALQLEKAAGVKLAYIPNNAGGAGAMRAVIAGEVLGGVNNLSDAFRAQAAGNVKILGVFDLERNEEFLPDVPTMTEQGFDIDNASVNFRGVMVPKGTPQPIIDKLAETVPAMFGNGRVKSRMAAGGSPMAIMSRDEVLEMWAAREETLKELLAGL
ncbi:C4-dicarboxylate ABC transporter substrate-binding protein [Thalassobacter stenotrophicus]|jgi:tripartite-type tricarboxylate transporter receptor subunit TctC|uniref:Tripartite tricarboxylate transporter family receptor n=2 Tax=Thalassobacter stenotrophicus TaxID=266809 RepID=A0A0P1FLD7_9RHOB|nr:tripartite tricarboxylate transporter substrate binding protein [Thalassobacter stenotrophicus]KGK79782.1 C4-dicarboxylate ABC transporter substrate-binding protein [Thalassobacter stenotrophicus]PVZ50248.1 tripartite tricarboxylate transporter substrate binding protein [Thalassobacter stenotrophicus]CUH59966.1 Tripartite tricarboxylate transporter family receptor [Thalassobacter stenotrophicus]SHJ40402.1 Tripartite-type tricarboxylate transporter, receptor component TctC [Thalassobacter ste